MISHVQRTASVRPDDKTYDSDTSVRQISVKIILLGDPCVGKTTVFRRFSSREVETVPDVLAREWMRSPTPVSGRLSETRLVGEYSKAVYVKGVHRLVLHIHDTAGQERYRSMTQSYFRGTDACLIFYDTCREATFMSIPDWHSDVKLMSNKDDVVVMIVGTRLADGERVVSRERAELMADSLAACYIEVDIENDFSVELLFKTLVEQYLASDSHRSLIQKTTRPLSRRSSRQEKVASRWCCCCC